MLTFNTTSKHFYDAVVPKAMKKMGFRILTNPFHLLQGNDLMKNEFIIKTDA